MLDAQPSAPREERPAEERPAVTPRRPKPYVVVTDPQTGAAQIPRCDLLDAKSDPSPVLDRLIVEAVDKLHLMAEGATCRMGAHRTRTVAGSTLPTGGEDYVRATVDGRDVTMHRLLAAYHRCETHRQRIRVIEQAQRAASRPQQGPRRDTDEWRALIAADQRSARLVADAYGLSVRTVRRFRAAARTWLGQQGVTPLGLAGGVT